MLVVAGHVCLICSVGTFDLHAGEDRTAGCCVLGRVWGDVWMGR